MVQKLTVRSLSVANADSAVKDLSRKPSRLLIKQNNDFSRTYHRVGGHFSFTKANSAFVTANIVNFP